MTKGCTGNQGQGQEQKWCPDSRSLVCYSVSPLGSLASTLTLGIAETWPTNAFWFMSYKPPSFSSLSSPLANCEVIAVMMMSGEYFLLQIPIRSTDSTLCCTKLPITYVILCAV